MAPVLDDYQPMTFRPTIEELTSVVDYVSYMERQGAHKAGIAKIIPPKLWIARKAGYDPTKLNMKLGTLVAHHIADSVEVPGCFMTETDLTGPSVTVSAYQQLAIIAKNLPPPHTCYNDLEQLYWQGVPSSFFTAEVQGTLTDSDQDLLNLAYLPNILTGTILLLDSFYFSSKVSMKRYMMLVSLAFLSECGRQPVAGKWKIWTCLH